MLAPFHRAACEDREDGGPWGQWSYGVGCRLIATQARYGIPEAH